MSSSCLYGMTLDQQEAYDALIKKYPLLKIDKTEFRERGWGPAIVMKRYDATTRCHINISYVPYTKKLTLAESSKAAIENLPVVQEAIALEEAKGNIQFPKMM